jgi:hypothetical protein
LSTQWSTLQTATRYQHALGYNISPDRLSLRLQRGMKMLAIFSIN